MTGPLELKKIAYNIFSELIVLWAFLNNPTIRAFVCVQNFPGTFKALRLLLLSEQMRYQPHLSAFRDWVKRLQKCVSVKREYFEGL